MIQLFYRACTDEFLKVHAERRRRLFKTVLDLREFSRQRVDHTDGLSTLAGKYKCNHGLSLEYGLSNQELFEDAADAVWNALFYFDHGLVDGMTERECICPTVTLDNDAA